MGTLPGFKIDVGDWYAWSIRLNQLPFNQFYSSNYFSDYTPGYLYILYSIGLLKNLLSLSDPTFYFFLKLPAIISEIAISAIAFIELKRHLSIKLSLLGTYLILFNLSLIFNSAIWGQIDSVLTLTMLLSIYFLKQTKLILSSIFLSIAILIKPQALILLPVFGLYFLTKPSLKNLFKLSLPALITTLLLSLPFFGPSSLISLIALIQKTSNEYAYTSLFAYNIWGVIGFWINDNQMFGPLDYKTYSILMSLFYFCLLAWFKFKKKLGLYSLTTLACLAFYFLPTRVHERYLYPALIFLVLAVIETKNYSIWIIQTVFSLIYLSSLYYVYVYYNEIYYKMPHVFFNSTLYNFLQNNSVGISIFSTFIFILSSWIILKSKHVQKSDKF